MTLVITGESTTGTKMDLTSFSVTLKVDHLSRTAESFDEGSDFELPTSFIYVVPKIREHDIDTEMVEEYEKSPTPCPESWSGRIAQSKDPRKSKEPSQTSTSVVLVEDSLGADANVEPIDAVPPVAHDDDVVKEDIDLDDSISGALHGPIRQTELLMAPSQTSQLPEDSLGASVSQQQKDRTVRFRLEQMVSLLVISLSPRLTLAYSSNLVATRLNPGIHNYGH